VTLGVAGDTLTDATGTVTAVTVIVDVPLKPLFVAVMMAVPGPTAVTSPAADTEAMDALDVLQSTVASVTGRPLTSSAWAARVPWEPTARLSCVGTTSTDATV
jgi:hypothetical protein